MRTPRGRVRVEGVNCSFFSPLGMGMREMAETASGLRSRPTWRGTWVADEVGSRGLEESF